MKRYYLSPIIGTGRRDPVTSAPDPFRAKVVDYGVSHVAVIPTDPITGIPLFPWALCLVDATNHTALLADTTLDAMPDVALDIKISAISAAARNALIRALNGRGLDGQAIVTSSDAFRNVLRQTGQALELTFDENNFDVNAA